jgi:hypothetical protein
VAKAENNSCGLCVTFLGCLYQQVHGKPTANVGSSNRFYEKLHYLSITTNGGTGQYSMPVHLFYIAKMCKQGFDRLGVALFDSPLDKSGWPIGRVGPLAT